VSQHSNHISYRNNFNKNNNYTLEFQHNYGESS
jgi:hypothetical protein